MAVEKTKDLWVFIETEDEGTAKSVGLELLVPGRRLADKQNGKLVAVHRHLLAHSARCCQKPVHRLDVLFR